VVIILLENLIIVGMAAAICILLIYIKRLRCKVSQEGNKMSQEENGVLPEDRTCSEG
jgi:hypothetical protein